MFLMAFLRSSRATVGRNALVMAGRVSAVVAASVLSASSLARSTADAGLRLSPMFGDHMVLQREVRAPIWGWAAPGQKVSVRVLAPDNVPTQAPDKFFSQPVVATADRDGKWMARLREMPAGGPWQVVVEAGETVTLSDVYFGDVWICSGQSNMEQGIGVSQNPVEEIAAADHPRLRLMTVPKTVAFSPQSTHGGTWAVCTPESVAKGGWGGFSAVAYYFGRQLLQDVDVPIGLVSTCWGGTVAEAWTSAEALSAMKEFRPAIQQVRAAAQNLAREMETQKVRMEAWFKWNDPGTSESPPWQSPDLDESMWKPAAVPGAWESAGLPDFDGLVWYRAEFVLTESQAAGGATLSLGAIDDADTTFVNGVEVGNTSVWDAPRSYSIGGSVLKRGRNVVAIRVLDTGGAGGLTGPAEALFVELADGRRVPLEGWKVRVAKPLARCSPVPVQLGNNPNIATVLYNGMIAPVAPFAIKGAIWYQGESNAGRAYQYRELLPTLIKDWRSRFGVGDFPFLIVSLANYMKRQPEPSEDWWAELREAQAMTAARFKNVGLAIAIDIGDADDIHPKNKQDVGKRLALQARRLAYGQTLAYSGPVYRSMKVVGNTIELSFDCAFNGLVARGDRLKGFAIAGADRKFVWADARIEGDRIVVSSPQVAKPVAVRYAWAANPDCNLYNGAGLPAVPFRTDQWPGLTAKSR